MDRDERRALTKELALEAGYRFIKFTTNSEHIHYGLFEPDIPADYAHLKQAQDRYLERIIAMVPSGVRRILDVGCGSGRTAEALLDAGYAVDCVAPGQTLAAIAAERLGDRATIYRTKFEDAAIPGRYDLVLFSESFQYIPMDAAVAKSIALLNPGGHILVSDFFRRADHRSTIRGGHGYDDWRAVYAHYPLDVAVEDDVTAAAAPLHDIVEGLGSEVVRPLYRNARIAAAARWPAFWRIGGRFLERRVDRLLDKRFSGKRTGAEFMKAKVYKMYLFKLRPSTA